MWFLYSWILSHANFTEYRQNPFTEQYHLKTMSVIKGSNTIIEIPLISSWIQYSKFEYLKILVIFLEMIIVEFYYGNRYNQFV